MSWKRVAGRTLGVILLLLIVLIISGYFYLQSNNFRQFAIREIVKEADSATGGRAQIGGLGFSLSTLTAHLYNVTVRGTESSDRPPLLHADELTVQLKIVSALHRKVLLREVLVSRPVVHFQVDRQGNSNLPTAPPSTSSSHESVFDLAVGHAQISNGEIDYNDRKIPLEADLHNLGTDIRFSSLAKRYDGHLSYESGTIRYAEYGALPHNLDLSFSATPSEFTLQSAVLRLASSSATLHGKLSDYENPVVEGEYRIQIHAQDFAGMMITAKAAGDVSLAGNLHYQAVANQQLLQSLSIDGRVGSEAVAVLASGTRAELRKLQGEYQLAHGELRLSDFTVDTLGGRIAANADIKNIDTTQESQVRAELRGISLKALQRTLHANEIQEASLSGTVNGTAEAAWKGSIANIRAHSDLNVRALATSRKNPSPSEVPVDGAIHLTYDGPRQALSLRQTTLRIPSAVLTAEGEVSNRSNLQIQFTANDLHQLVGLAYSFIPQEGTVPAVSGSATLHATVQGSLKRPTVAAQLGAQNLQVEGSQWKSLGLQMRANPSRIDIENGSLVAAQRGRATFSANAGLRNWSYQPENIISAHMDVEKMSVTDLERLAKLNLPISGDLSAKLALEGSELSPAGSGSVQLANGRAYGEQIQNLSAKFNAANGSITSTVNLAVAAGSVDADLKYTPKTKAYVVKLDAPAIVLGKLQAVQERNLGLSGTISVTVNGQGAIDNPQLNAIVQMPELNVRQNSITGTKAELRIADHRANLDLNTQVSQASVHAHGNVALTGDYETNVAIDTGKVPLEVLMATYAPSVPAGFQGETELHASVAGPLKDKSKLEAHLSIPVLQASYQGLQVGITKPIQADYANSVVTLQPASIRGTDTSIDVQGRLPLAGNGVPTLSANGTVDVRILKIFAPAVDSSGTLALDVHASGSTSRPELQGQLQFKDIAMSTADAPIALEKLNGTLNISGDRVQVAQMTAQVGGGNVSVGGSITYKPSLQFNLAVQGKSIRLLYPGGLRSLLDANLAFSGTAGASTLNGRVLVDRLSFTPDFDLSKFANQFSNGGTISQPGFADTINLAIALQSQENLSATSSQVSIEGQAALRIGGTAANPVITGRTTLTSGELFYRNVRYQLQTGLITFDNPTETHPVLNISVATTVEQYSLTLTMRGPLDKLTTSYVSDPPLATADIINLIARGQTTEESAASSQSTDSMVASQAASQLAGGLQNLAGLSSLQINPLMGGNGQNPTAQVALQQRVTKNFLFTFSTDVSEPGTEMVQGEYQLNKRWSVNATRDQLGGISVGARYHTRF
ncbi:MAG TPA: translocation/assembly module TamB domain-containing protein [Candidatus Sulfotelmatobacter sp.]